MQTSFAFVLLTLVCSTTYADVTGKMIAFNCYSCHGEKLARLTAKPHSSKQLTKTLIAFKTGKKSATIMDRITKGYSDAELAAVAQYIIRLD